MELFGMGLLLDVKDNASSSLKSINSLFNQTYNSAGELADAMNKAQQSISNLAMGCTSLIYGGKNLISFGNNITNTFKQMGMQVIKTGSQFENYNKTLEALYKNEDIAKEKANWAMDLASTTPFEITDVMSALIGLKAAGVDADKTFADANGEMRTFLEYVGDLAALRPDIGMDGVMRGIRNLLGGNKKSIEDLLDIKLEQQLGRKLAKTPEGLLKDVVDVSQKLAGGLMQKLEGTWEQLVSNLRDQQTRFMKAISDGGAFDVAKNTLKKFSAFIGGIDTEELSKLGNNLAIVFEGLWKPVDMLADGVIKVLNFVKELILVNPELVKSIASLTMFSGIAITLVGVLAVLGGTLGLVRVGLAQFKIFALSLATKIGVLSKSVGGFSAVMGLLASKVLVVVGAVTLLYQLWQRDFLGIKTATENFVNNMVDFAKILFDAWDYELSDENFTKAQELGLLPLLNTILDIKMYTEAFFKGFISGFNTLIDTLVWVGEKVIWVKDKVVELLTNLGIIKPKIDDLAPKDFDTSGWEKIGEIAGLLTGIFLGSSIVSKVLAVGSSIMSIVTTLGGPLLSAIGGLLTAIGPVGWAIMAVVAVFGVLYATCDEFRAWWDVVWGHLKEAVMGLIDFIMGVFSGDWERAWTGLCDFVVGIFQGTFELIKPIINAIIGLINMCIRGLNKIQISAPDWDWLPDSVQGKSWGVNISEIPKLNTGGYVKDEGISMLHPNEVVINDPLTRKLKSFLDTEDNNDNPKRPKEGSSTSNNQSLVVEKGAIVIQVQNGSQEDAEAIANTVIKKIEKKARIKKVLSYQ